MAPSAPATPWCSASAHAPAAASQAASELTSANRVASAAGTAATAARTARLDCVVRAHLPPSQPQRGELPDLLAQDEGRRRHAAAAGAPARVSRGLDAVEAPPVVARRG